MNEGWILLDGDWFVSGGIIPRRCGYAEASVIHRLTGIDVVEKPDSRAIACAGVTCMSSVLVRVNSTIPALPLSSCTHVWRRDSL